MQTYKVTGYKVILGVGISLKLSKSQSGTRTHSLKQKKNGIYTILEPVQFKQGEVITIVSGNVSKAVLANLEEPSKGPKQQEQIINTSNSNTSKPTPKDKKKKDESDNLNSNSEKDSDKGKIISNNDVNSLPVTEK